MSPRDPDAATPAAGARAARMRQGVLAVLGPTATGKSALGLALAEQYDGEIVSCDSAAVYRGFDIGTDRVPLPERRGIPHHLVDVADPADNYNAAQYARDASAAIFAIHGRGRVPILVGGTGFYYRALTRGLFPGPGGDWGLRARLRRIAERHGAAFLHRMVRRVDPASAARIQPGDKMRLVRALEVYFLTGRPLTSHFAETQSPLGAIPVVALGVRLPGEDLLRRIARRVDAQFERGLIDEVRGLLARGVREDAQPFRGLGYRQALELLHGVRSEADTRELIVRESRRYARRQLIWFRKEPNLVWFEGPGESVGTIAKVAEFCDARLAGRGVRRAGEGRR